MSWLSHRRPVAAAGRRRSAVKIDAGAAATDQERDETEGALPRPMAMKELRRKRWDGWEEVRALGK